MLAMPFFLRTQFSIILFFLCAFALFSFAKQECFAQGAVGLVLAPPDTLQPDAQGGAPQEVPQAAPQAQPPKDEKEKLQRISDDLFSKGGWWGTGGYFSLIKLPLYIVIFLIWVGSASWINADQERLRKENREVFNLTYLLLYGVLGTVIFFVPMFWVAF